MRFGRACVTGALAGTVAAVLLVAVPAAVQAQAPVRATLSGRMHYQWNTTSIDQAEAAADAPIAASTFETRRVRLTVDVQVSDWIRGTVEPEFSMGRLALRHAFMAFELDSALVVRAGQFKKPFSLVHLTSSTRLPVIERGVRIRGLDAVLQREGGETMRHVRGEMLMGEQFTLVDAQRYAAYDMGVALEGVYGPFGWAAGVFNGTGPDMRAENSGLSAAARATWRVTRSGPVVLGAAWSRRELNWPAPSAADTRAGNAFGVDMEVGGFRRGLWLLAEASTGDNLATEERFAGATLIASYFAGTGGRRVEGIEPVARVSWGDPDRAVDGDDAVLLTPGLNVYFAGRNRFMLNWDVYVPAGDAFSTQHAARAQFNLAF